MCDTVLTKFDLAHGLLFMSDIAYKIHRNVYLLRC